MPSPGLHSLFCPLLCQELRRKQVREKERKEREAKETKGGKDTHVLDRFR